MGDDGTSEILLAEPADRFQAWGMVDEDRAIYVRRPADEQYVAAVLGGKDCLVLGSRQSGKSSLVNHALPTLQDKGLRVAWVDLGSTNPLPGIPVNQWLSNFVRELFRSTGEAEAGRRLAEQAMPSVTEALRALCEQAESRVLVVLDELDSLEQYPSFAKEVATQLRAAMQARAREPSLRRLLVSVCAVKRPADLLAELAGYSGAREIAGENLWLEDFAFDEDTIDDIAKGFPAAKPARRDLARHALEFSGGYPIACMWACRTIVRRDWDYSQDLPELLRNEVERIRKRPEDFLLVTESYLSEHPLVAPEGLTAYQQVLSGQVVAYNGQDPAHNLLVWSGLCRVSEGRIRPRCPLLEQYFNLPWTTAKLERIRRVGYRRAARRRRSDRTICILNTGGTIGMVEYPDGTVRTPEDPSELPFGEVDRITEYEAVTLFSRDSADVGPRDWATIANTIKQREGRYHGFVVAHGTDTLAYSASAVAFALGPRLTFPVVFTGSQTTVDVDHGDARSNILRSALVAIQDLPEVVVCFGGHILRASRAQKKDDYRYDAFESPGHPPLGYVAEDVDLLPQNLRQNRQPGPIELKARFTEGILQVAQTPGALARFYEGALEQVDDWGRRLCRGVIIQSLGAGNVPTVTDYDLTPLIRRAIEVRIPVVLTSQYPVQPRNFFRYSPAEAAINAGAVPTGNMTVPAVVAKLSWVLADVDRQISEGGLTEDRRVEEVKLRMQRDEVGEVGTIVVEELERPSALDDGSRPPAA